MSISKKLLLFIFLFIGCSVSSAQEIGRIQGAVIDSMSGNSLFGANVWLQGTTLGAASDLDGNYIITKVPAGTYTLVARYIGYQQKEIPVEVRPGATTTLNIALMAEVIEGETVVITGQAAGQLGAINQQLSSNTIKNVVSSEKIRELPDESAATALSRLPGLSLMEGDKVVIRGIESRLNTVLINGIQLPSTDQDDRSTNLGFISSNMLAGIEVTKVLTPDMDANAIGGVVNLRLKEAPEDLHFDFLAQGGYNTLGETADNYQFWGSISNRFFDNNLGVFIQGNARRLNGGTQFGTANFGLLGPGESLGYGQATYGMNQFSYGDQVNVSTDYGGSIILDYRLPNGKLVLQNSLAFTDNDLTEHQDVLNFTNVRRQITIRRDLHTKKLLANALQGEHTFGDLSLDYSFAHAYSDKETDLRYGDSGDQLGFTIPAPFAPLTNNERLAMTPEMAYQIQLNTDSVDVAKIFESASTRNEEFNQRILAGYLNLSMPFTFSDFVSAKFKIGGKYDYNNRENNIDRHYARITENPAERNRGAAEFLRSIGQDPTQILALGYFLDRDYDQDEFLGGKYGNMLHLNKDYMDQYLRLAPPEWVPGIHLSRTLQDDFSGSERLLGSYAMTEINIGPALTILGGIRYERYNMDFDANFVYETHAIDGLAIEPDTLNSVERTYDHWFPNLQLRYKFTEWMDVRAAYTKSISRPDYIMIIPKIFQAGRGNGKAGNPNLRPAISTNLDLYFSFYNNEIGLFTVGGFYKEINDFFYQVVRLYTVLPDDAWFPKPEVFEKYDLELPQPGAEDTTYTNNPTPAYLRGLEFDWQTNFWYLPAPFNSMVLNINYTRNWSNVDYAQIRFETVDTMIDGRLRRLRVEREVTRNARLLNQSDHILNVALGYDYKGFSFRVSMRLQSNVITSIGNVRPEEDQFSGDVYRWDFNIKQELPIPGLTVFLSGINIANNVDENFRSFRRDINENIHNNLSRVTYNPRRFELGIRYAY